MVESAAGSTGRIFISYRREETAYPAGWLFDRLADHFGAGQIFKDVDSIELGDDFVEMITRAVGSCDVLLALIGDRWLTITDKQGRRRLDDPNDFVRLEIEAALKRKVRIIPILVEGAPMPHADELPAAIAGLARRQALELSPSRFEYDTSRLLRVLVSTLADVRTAQVDAAAIDTSTANAPDQRIDTQQSHQQPEQQTKTRMQDIPPAAPATPAWDRPSADQTKPPDRKSRRLPGRVLVLVGILTAVVVFILALTSGGVLYDDFSDQANGWDDAGSTRTGGHYTNGAYRIYAQPTGEDHYEVGAPRQASKAYPAAPRDIEITVDAKAIAAPAGTAYGIACRVGQNSKGFYGYGFTVGPDSVRISKLGVDGSYREVVSQPLPEGFNTAGINHLRAVCSSDEGDQAGTHLVFSMNDNQVAEATDTENPLGVGTVALFAATSKDSKKAVEVEFDNFDAWKW
jgi:hypothetical protein